MASDTKYDHRLEEGLLPVATDEKTGSNTSRTPTEPARKMNGGRRVLLAFVVCGLMTLSLASVLGHHGMPCRREHHQAQFAVGEEDIKDPAKVDLLHRLLHAYLPERYQDGVYASDKDALAAVEADDADLASTLSQMAKRQDNNTTASATPSVNEPATSTQEPATNTPTPTPTTTPPAPETTTTPAPQPETTTTPQPETTTTPQPQTTTTPQPQTTTTTTTQAQPTTPTTPATSAAPTSGTSQTEQAPPSSSTTAGPPSTSSEPQTTPQSTRQQATTSTSSRRTTTSYSQVRSTFTSTASNGDVVLVTAYSTVAVPPDPEPTAESGSSSGGGGLQNAAVPLGSVSFGVPLALAAFVGGAMIML